MARPYIPEPDDVVAEYPGNVFTPWPLQDRATDNAPISEPFTVPGAANQYAVRLDSAILEQVSLTIVVNGITLLPVRWRDNPGAGEVAVFPDRGLLKFHSSLEGLSGTCAHTPLGSVVDAQWQSQMQKEMAATQQAIADGVGGTLAGLTDTDIDGTQTNGQVLTWDDTAGKAVFADPTGGGGADSLDDLEDVDTTGANENDLLVYESGGWTPKAPSDAVTLDLDDLSDVAIATPAAGQILEHNGTNWINGRKITISATEPVSPAEGDIWFDIS